MIDRTKPLKVRALADQLSKKLGLVAPQEKKEFFINDIENERISTINNINQSRRRPIMGKIKNWSPERKDSLEYKLSMGDKIIDILYAIDCIMGSTYSKKSFRELSELLFHDMSNVKSNKTFLRNLLTQLRVATSDIIYTDKKMWQVHKSYVSGIAELKTAWRLNHGKVWIDAWKRRDKSKISKSGKEVSSNKEIPDEFNKSLESPPPKVISISDTGRPIELTIKVGEINITIKIG